ncbi:unnamed protein product [Clonostachys rosea]|uniref:Calcineurin-like phosphoesterase domain-containing protein n=1 Tax=Bionectria ochroleuca TaxID=29856 RepID=A0ABY6V673_BIOOC|nr:unnamed protein product [Clonostachys rosea]
MATQRLAVWKPPSKSPWQKFRSQPAIVLAALIHGFRPRLNPERSDTVTTTQSSPIFIVCISDTHMSQPDVPDGDLLLHAGDLTNGGTFDELQAQLGWIASLPHRYKVVIAGNHDRLLDPEYVAKFPDKICEYDRKARIDLDWHDIIYLNNSSAVLSFDGNGVHLNIFGSSWTPQCGTFAYQYPPIRDVWMGNVPDDTDILLTHGPPKGYLDLDGKGCPNLLREIARVRPNLVVFGHIHAGHGRQDVVYNGVERHYQKVMAGDGQLSSVFLMAVWLLISWLEHMTIMVNAAVVSGAQNEAQPAITVEWRS